MFPCVCGVLLGVLVLEDVGVVGCLVDYDILGLAAFVLALWCFACFLVSCFGSCLVSRWGFLLVGWLFLVVIDYYGGVSLVLQVNLLA